MPAKIPPELTGSAIRQTFLDFFVEHGHTYVPSSSLVPGGDATLLFANSGMVQFKDVFLGTDKRSYTRAVNSQKCLRVAGKHNDLEDVGRDDTHHTFFEMLGNWSFGDYYKKEAIEWAWRLLTDVWGLPKERLYATVFRDEQGTIPADDEAAGHWRDQPGFLQEQVYYFGRKDNFWEMAETGPCGPNSEVLFDLRPEEGKVTQGALSSDRFVELWNLVFIQYNRVDAQRLEALPARHVDTGMGLERIVAILQGVNSNYRTDLLWPVVLKTQELTGHSDEQREANFTSYRVIADHARSAAFLIADGVIPGNLGRNYVTRMIVRRAFRFGGKIGLTEPFLANVADVVIESYAGHYPELSRNRKAILAAISREEEQFQRTLDRTTTYLQNLLDQLRASGGTTLAGNLAADLYTTYGMPFEITRDIAEERGLAVDQTGFQEAMDTHRLASGAGAPMGTMDAGNTDLYQQILDNLLKQGRLGPEGVVYDPYDLSRLNWETEVVGLIVDRQLRLSAKIGDQVEVILPWTGFYLESGGQVDDTGWIRSKIAGSWQIRVESMSRPVSGLILHSGRVLQGEPRSGEAAIAEVDITRRWDIMRNHTATHLLHSALHAVLGDHARQAGSLVAPDRLRFDFNHPHIVTGEELERIETFVNEKILGNLDLQIVNKPLKQAISEGAMALFGEKYSEAVRTIRIGDFSYELCGGTHLKATNSIGLFTITSEGSAAAGIRRIEAITGRAAFQQAQHQKRLLAQTGQTLATAPDHVVERTQALLDSLELAQKEVAALRTNQVAAQFAEALPKTHEIAGVRLLAARLEGANAEILRHLADQFRERYPEKSVAVLATVEADRPILIAAVSKDLNSRGLRAGDLAGYVARQLGGGGGGKPTLAQAGGKEAGKLEEALRSVAGWVQSNLK